MLTGSRERRRRGRWNGLIGRTLMLNKRAGQFYKGIHCKETRQLKIKARMSLKRRWFCTECTDKLWCTFVFHVLTLWMFRFIQIHSNSFIQMCPLKAFIWTKNGFQSHSKSYFPALWSFSLAWLSHVKLLKVKLALLVSWIFLKATGTMLSSFIHTVLCRGGWLFDRGWGALDHGGSKHGRLTFGIFYEDCYVRDIPRFVCNICLP